MTESNLARYIREVRYNLMLKEMLVDYDYLIHYGPEGRTFEVKTSVPGLVILFKTAPLPQGKVLLVVKANKMKSAVIEEIDERLLKQRLYKWIGELLG